jgi:hypothetical protein
MFSSETTWPNGAKLGRKYICKIFYKTSSFGSIRNKKQKVLKFRKFDEKRAITPKWVMGFT